MHVKTYTRADIINMIRQRHNKQEFRIHEAYNLDKNTNEVSLDFISFYFTKGEVL